MIYCNKRLLSEARTFDFGTISQVSMGEKGRGRQLLTLTCPENTVVESGMNPDLTIGLTRSGKPRILRQQGEQLYMLLSSEGGYTRRGNGSIAVLKDSGVKILAVGNGADGDAGRIGQWDVALLRVPADCVIRVRTSGAGYGTPADYYVVRDNVMFHCTPDTLAESYELLGLEVPFSLEFDGETWSIVNSEWVNARLLR